MYTCMCIKIGMYILALILCTVLSEPSLHSELLYPRHLSFSQLWISSYLTSWRFKMVKAGFFSTSIYIWPDIRRFYADCYPVWLGRKSEQERLVNQCAEWGNSPSLALCNSQTVLDTKIVTACSCDKDVNKTRK